MTLQVGLLLKLAIVVVATQITFTSALKCSQCVGPKFLCVHPDGNGGFKEYTERQVICKGDCYQMKDEKGREIRGCASKKMGSCTSACFDDANCTCFKCSQDDCNRGEPLVEAGKPYGKWKAVPGFYSDSVVTRSVTSISVACVTISLLVYRQF